MPKPTTLSGWWYLLLEKRGGGNVALLASLIPVSTRTLNKWGHGVKATGENRRRLRKLAGKALLQHELCPKYLKWRPKVETHD
jgi:hypothetical protein